MSELFNPSRPGIYPGSVFEPCQGCAVHVSVGLRQQEAREVAAEVGLAAHVFCMLCAVEMRPVGDASGEPVQAGAVIPGM